MAGQVNCPERVRPSPRRRRESGAVGRTADRDDEVRQVQYRQVQYRRKNRRIQEVVFTEQSFTSPASREISDAVSKIGPYGR